MDGRRASVVEDHPEPALGAGMALVEVRLAGICSTDLQILAGYMGFRGILGHEFVGEVIEGPDELVGARVAGKINFACGLRNQGIHSGPLRGAEALPVPTSLLIDGEGKVLWMDQSENYQQRSGSDYVLAALRTHLD